MSIGSLLKGRGGLAALTRHSDLILAGLVVGIVAMMIIPLPTPLLDVLITANISGAVILLLVCIYVDNALRIAALPSILLLTTLFRLGLNVSSTRLILLQADAGEVIRSFGNFVVAGSLAVGAVIFLILTLIQFVVIAKGSERVAEVAARFTLDAMPGKQMAIDADLRAGTIDVEDARRQRSALQRESQLYGSMDGAMKFVKGDAIAGILITIINIVAGLLIGVLQHGMPAGDAARLYSILTIGDGLVSQIPALLISTAAGIVVTRVASEDEGAHLGREIGRQIMAQPKAIAIGAVLLLLLALIPGLPALPFMIIGIACGAVAWALLRAGRDAKEAATSRGTVDAAGLPATDRGLDPPPPIALEVGRELTPFIDASTAGGQLMGELIPGLRELLHSELGVTLPGVHVRGDAASVPPRGYRVLLSEIPMAEGQIDDAALLCLCSAERLAADGVSGGETASVPGVEGPLCRLPLEAAEAIASAGVEVLDPPTQMVLHLSQVLRTYAYEFVGIQEAQALLDGLERSHPTLVHEVVPKVVSIQLLSEVLRRLVEEEISIRDMRQILQALAEWGQTERDPAVLTEHVRGALKRQISHKYSAGVGALQAILLDPMIEQVVRDSIQATERGSYLALEPELSREIVDAVRGEFQAQPKHELSPVILTTMEIRRYVRRLLEVDLPSVVVLSYTELQSDVQVQAVARVSVA